MVWLVGLEIMKVAATMKRAAAGRCAMVYESRQAVFNFTALLLLLCMRNAVAVNHRLNLILKIL